MTQAYPQFQHHGAANGVTGSCHRYIASDMLHLLIDCGLFQGQEAQNGQSIDFDLSLIRALIVTGGCCHDYPFQTKAMIAAAKKRNIEIEWKVVNEGGNGTKAQIDLYDNADWAKGFDVVIHNECFANTTNEDYIRRITSVHNAGVNAVVIHCAMHTYRATKIDDWREFLNRTSTESKRCVRTMFSV